jgi:serum/glucocorticoid-regulated kinase 2
LRHSSTTSRVKDGDKYEDCKPPPSVGNNDTPADESILGMLADVVPPCTLLTITATADVLTQAPLVKSRKPGVLFVVLHRARGLSIPKQRQDAFESQHPTTPHTFNDTNAQVSGKFTPYALIDFDKSQAFVGSVGGTLEEPSWAGTSTQYKFDVTRVTELNIHLYV